MTTGTFILKNALRHKRRAELSILSVAASPFLLVTLLGWEEPGCFTRMSASPR